MTQAADCQYDEDATKVDWDGRYLCAGHQIFIQVFISDSTQ